MSADRFVIQCPHAISLIHTVHSHGWVRLSPWVWSEEAGMLSRADRLASGGIASIKVAQQSPRSLSVDVDPTGEGPVNVEEVRAVVSRWLSVDWDPAPAIEVASRISSQVAAFLRDGGGRLLRSSTFYEDFAKTVCTIQIAWSGTQRMVTSLVEAIGDGVFPTPRQVLDTGESTLRKKARLGFRAPQLLAATERLMERGLMDELGQESQGRITYDELIGLRGIGPYAASHTMVLLHDFSRIPVDSLATRFYGERHGLAPDQIQAFFDKWGEYRFMGHHLSRRLST